MGLSRLFVIQIRTTDFVAGYNVIDALTYIKLVAKEDDCPERYAPLVYFLLATAQLLNPSISIFWEILVVSHVDVNTKQKFDGHRKAFLRYQLQDPATKEKVTPPPKQDIFDHWDTANITEH